jgi:ubiquinone/menaquinone biosynthesis C-methylase UbiE
MKGKQGIQGQYDAFASKYVEENHRYNTKSDECFFRVLGKDFKDLKILDIGCGNGEDLKRYHDLGAIVLGLDASLEMIKMAEANAPYAELTQGFMENLPYDNSTFDLVVSKYVLQTSTDVPKVISEMTRVLKRGGMLQYLAVHPLRQFLEKKKDGKDYFLQEIVHSVFFEGKVTALEPSHTFNEYLNPKFLRYFEMLNFEEHDHFPDSERINGDNYPCFFIVKAKKK